MVPGRHLKIIISTVLSIVLALNTVQPGFCTERALLESRENALQAADILCVRPQVERILVLNHRDNLSESEKTELLILLDRVYRSVMRGVCEVKSASNKIEREITYTYDLLEHAGRKKQTVGEIFTLLNFLQFGTLYSLEGLSRRKNQFIQSDVLTAVSAGLGILLPVSNLAYQKFSRTRNTKPKGSIARYVSGKGVNDLHLPETVEKFLNLKAPGTGESRRKKLYEVWEQRFGSRALASDAMYSLLDKNGKTDRYLSLRGAHLWNIHTFIQDFDYSLLALLKLIRPNFGPSSLEAVGQNLKLSNSATAAIRLLGLEGEVDELRRLHQSGDNSTRHRELELLLIGRLLEASLEMRTATDKIYEELNYTYDVVLAELERKKAKELQLIYDANFTQINTFGATASLLYFKNRDFAGNMMFIIGDSISIGLTSLALVVSRGGKRKIDYPPNSLADFLDLNPPEEYRLSGFVTSFLESSDPGSNSALSHKEELKESWKRDKIATSNLNKAKVKAQLAATDDVKYDNIKICRDRIALLHSLRVRLQMLDRDLLQVLQATEPIERIDSSVLEDGGKADQFKETAADHVAHIIGVKPELHKLRSIQSSMKSREPVVELDINLKVARKVLKAMLEVRKTSANIEEEIIREQAAIGRLIRYRDAGIKYTNLLNFYQIGILGVIIDGPFGLTTSSTKAGTNDKMTIISGMTAGALGIVAFLQRKGGIRLKRPDPNMLGPCFELDTPAKSKYTPVLLSFLNEKDPQSDKQLTRRQELINYWRETRLLPLDVTREANTEKVSSKGKHYHWWNETIGLIRSRITMLYDLRSVVNVLEDELATLLRGIERNNAP